MLVDHHCHLDFPDFAADRAAYVARAKVAGVATLVTISTRIRNYDIYRGIAEAFPHSLPGFTLGPIAGLCDSVLVVFVPPSIRAHHHVPVLGLQLRHGLLAEVTRIRQ